MNSVKKLFFNTKITYTNLIIGSIIIGVFVGLLMIPAFLENTSIRQMGISYEFWVFSAMFIILNSETAKEAGMKTFIYFLISQPLIYLVQVPFSYLGWELFGYYRPWFILTLLTFPGGMIAWYTKKGNWLSILILSVANYLLCMHVVGFSQTMIADFPRLLLAILFIIGQMILYVELLFKDQMKKIVTYGLIVLMIISLIFSKQEPPVQMTVKYMDWGEEPYTLVEKVNQLHIDIDDQFLKIKYEPGLVGEFQVSVKDTKGEIRHYHLTVEGDYSDIEEVD